MTSTFSDLRGDAFVGALLLDQESGLDGVSLRLITARYTYQYGVAHANTKHTNAQGI